MWDESDSSNEGSVSNSTNNFEPGKQSRDGIEFKSLDVVTLSPLLIDNKEIYYKGFLSLTNEEKARALLGFLLTSDYPSVTNLDDINPNSVRDRIEIGKENKLFKLKFYGISIFMAIIGLASVGIIGLFMYISLDKGVLDDNGVLTGVLSTLQEVFRIIFTDPTSGSSL